MDYTSWQNELNKYFQAHPQQNPMMDWSLPMDQWAGSTQANDLQNYQVNTYQNFLKGLSPDQQSDYLRAMNENYAKGDRTHQLMFAASLAAMGGLGALNGAFSGTPAAAGNGLSLGGEGMFSGDLASFFPGAETGMGGFGTDLAAGGLAGTGGVGALAGGSPWESFMSSLTGGNALKSAGGSLLSQLIAAGGNAYQGNKAAGQYNDVINQINSLFAPDSAYAKQMQQALERKDAAAGRNSQYGDRSVQLAAALTQAKANALTSQGYGNLLAQRGINQNIPLNGLGAFLGSTAGQDLVTQAGGTVGNWLSNLFGNSGTNYSPTSPNSGFNNDWLWAYAPGG